MLLLLCSSLFAQEIEYRMSESQFKQKNLEYSQNGVLVRFGHQKLQRFDMENKAENIWQCKELWVAKNTRSEKIKDFIQAEFPVMNAVSLNSVVENYQAKVKVDTTASWGKDDIIKKLLELEKRLEKLEGL